MIGCDEDKSTRTRPIALPEQTANRKLTSCQNGEISEETTQTQRESAAEPDTKLQTCPRGEIYVSVHTKTGKHSHTAAFPAMLSGDSGLPFLEECHCTCTNTHEAVPAHRAALPPFLLFLGKVPFVQR